jgi:hypothetical protein
MSDKPRMLWQIHLSTAVICSLYIGVAMPFLFKWHQAAMAAHSVNGEVRFSSTQIIALSVVAVFLLTTTSLVALVLEYLARRSGANGRSFWRIHLSTMIALMIVASALVGLNITSRELGPEYERPGEGNIGISAWEEPHFTSEYHDIRVTGWPFVMWFEGNSRRSNSNFSSWVLDHRNANIAIAVGLLVATAACFEFLARRRSGP